MQKKLVKKRAKKSLGQNFLVDENILKKIVEINIINSETEIIEIGPGTGNLTDYLIKKNPKKIFAIEKDKELSKNLLNKYFGKAEIINEDILKFFNYKIFNKNTIIIGNLPYNISSQILVKFILDNNFSFKALIFMFQKEMANRILAKVNSKDYGRLSILSNWRFQIEKLFDIKPSSFSPRPKVESSLLLFRDKIQRFHFRDSKNLEKITRIFFMHRRKMIKKPYNQLFNNNTNIASKIGIDLNSRPQNLDFEKYFQLTKEYEELRG